VANNEEHDFADLADLQVIREQPGTMANIVNFPYNEEVAGSIGHRPLRKSVDLQVKVSLDKVEPEPSPGSLTTI
jgi:hypothetical protein